MADWLLLPTLVAAFNGTAKVKPDKQGSLVVVAVVTGAKAATRFGLVASAPQGELRALIPVTGLGTPEPSACREGLSKEEHVTCLELMPGTTKSSHGVFSTH